MASCYVGGLDGDWGGGLNEIFSCDGDEVAAKLTCCHHKRKSRQLGAVKATKHNEVVLLPLQAPNTTRRKHLVTTSTGNWFLWGSVDLWVCVNCERSKRNAY